MSNPFTSRPASLTGIPRSMRDVTPADGADIEAGAIAIALRIKPNSGAAGTVAFHDADGVERSTEMAVGETLPGAFRRVLATGTTATGIEAWLA